MKTAIVSVPELVSAGSELFVVTGLHDDTMNFRVLEQSGEFLGEENPVDRRLDLKYLGRFHTRFLLGTFGVHHQVCIDTDHSRSFHDTWFAVGDQSMRQPALADFAIDAWFDTIMRPL